MEWKSGLMGLVRLVCFLSENGFMMIPVLDETTIVHIPGDGPLVWRHAGSDRHRSTGPTQANQTLPRNTVNDKRPLPAYSSTLNVRGRGGSASQLFHATLRESLLRTFFHQQSPYTWSCIALWHERATDMCAHITQCVPIQHYIRGRLIHRSSPATFS